LFKQKVRAVINMLSDYHKTIGSFFKYIVNIIINKNDIKIIS